MRVLGIDYGRRKIGVAISLERLAEPYSVFEYKSLKKLLDYIGKTVKKEGIDKVVVGVSEGKIGKESKAFADKLKDALTISVELQDETLTSQRARELSIQAGIKKKKRKELEHAYSASLILQDFLDRGF